MSLCFRSLPGKLSSLVSGRNPLSKFDRQLRKHESSAFLEQFLVLTQRALSVKTNATDRTLVPSVSCILHQNLSLISLDSCNQWNEKLFKKRNEKNGATYCAQARRPHRSQKIVLPKIRKHVAHIGIISNNVTLWNKTVQTENVRNDKNNSFLDNSRILLSENLYCTQESNMKRDTLFMDDMSTLKTNQQQSSEDNDGKPSQEQLQRIFDCLSADIPQMFVKPQTYGIYTQDLIFINNIRGVTTKGLLSYIKQLSLLKAIGHIRFAHVKCDIIKITKHVEDGTIKVRWRIRGISGLKMLSSFWKYKIWKIKENIEKDQELWYDGFSTFYVNNDGKIYKHIADKVMPDQDTIQKKDLQIASKLALFTGLMGIFDNGDCLFRISSILKFYKIKEI